MERTAAFSIFVGLLMLIQPNISFAHGTAIPHDHLLASKAADFRTSIKDMRENLKVQTLDLRVKTKADLEAASTTQEKRGILKSAVQDKKELRKDTRATTTALRAEAKSAVKRHLGLIAVRFEVALKQFENLQMRIESRIAKFKERGVDATTAEAKLDAAAGATATAKTDIRAVRDLVTSAENTDDPKAMRAEIDAAIKEAGASIKAAHAAYIEAARALMSAPKTNVESTSEIN